MNERTEKDILRDVKALAVEYYDRTGKPLGVTGEIAEFEAADKLGLELAEARSPGWDAVSADGTKIQIKGRYKKDGKKWGRVPKINIDKKFDAVVLVLLHGDFQVHQIWKAKRNDVIARLREPGSRARNERYSMTVTQFRSIAKPVWSSD